MRGRTGTIAAALSFSAVAGAAVAAEPDIAPRLSLVVAGLGAAGKGPSGAGATARAETGIEASWLLQSGATLGYALGLTGEADDRLGGIVRPCAPPSACPTHDGRPAISPLSRLAADSDAHGGRPRAAVDQAYLFVRGGWGEASLGRDEGMGARFSLPPPTIAQGAGLTDPNIDATGLGGVRIRADLSGPSAKVGYATPRWLGVKLGASFSPRVEGVNLDDPAAATQAPRFAGRQVREIGASFDHVWPGGIRTLAGAAWAHAESARTFGDVDLASYGLQLARGRVRAGVSAFEGRAAAAQGRDTRSTAVGIVIDAGAWAYEVSAGRMRDQWLDAGVRRGQIAARRTLSDSASVALVGSVGARTSRGNAGGSGPRQTGLGLEIALKL